MPRLLSQLRRPPQSSKMKDCCPVAGRAWRLGESCEICSCCGVLVIRSVANTLEAEQILTTHAAAAILRIVAPGRSSCPSLLGSLANKMQPSMSSVKIRDVSVTMEFVSQGEYQKTVFTLVA